MEEIRLHEYQTPALDSKKRFIALIAGTGGGKTFFGAPWLYNEIQKYPTDSFIVAAPTYKMLQRATIPALINCFRGTLLEGEFKESKGQYLLPTGGVIYFGSADNPDTLEGPHVRAAWLDEAGLMKRMVWVIIQSRVGKNLGRILITTTPRALNWLYHDFYKRFIAGDKDYDVFQFRSCDSPYYPQEEFERMKNTLDSRTFELRYCGQFRKMTGLVYIDFEADNIIDALPAKSFTELRIGVDWGYNNPSVILPFVKDNDGVWYQVDEWYQRGKLFDDVMAHTIQMVLKYTRQFNLPATICCDPSEPSYIETFLRAGLNAVGADNAIAPGIQETGMLIKSKRLRVIRSCVNTIEEYETYHYPEESQKDVPVKEDDHCMDATRYAMRGPRQVEEQDNDIITAEDVGIERVEIGAY